MGQWGFSCLIGAMTGYAFAFVAELEAPRSNPLTVL